MHITLITSVSKAKKENKSKQKYTWVRVGWAKGLRWGGET